MADQPVGLALYVRKISLARHGTPKQLAKHFADHGAKWVALAGPWHERRNGVMRTGLMNGVDTVRRYADAMWDRDIDPYVWGYPWQGTEEKFADQMNDCAGEFNLALLDPELGSNPERAPKGPGKARANAHAELLVRLMAERFAGGICGLSTYGSGVRMRTFPLYAFARALASLFPRRTFIGGQTYTEDPRIDPSIADFLKVIRDIANLDTIALVPNFGAYGRKPDGKARSKTPHELDAHFMEFIDEGEPVEGMIGWAENFMTSALWRSFARMAERMQRGACRLPSVT
jgi:hypothetical protein